ncbi:MAG: hypothetical protein IBJ09_10480 [Bacteroidia bacterium]|nr:hypothetical protein [Bacteroidia bacterium]
MIPVSKNELLAEIGSQYKKVRDEFAAFPPAETARQRRSVRRPWYRTCTLGRMIQLNTVSPTKMPAPACAVR